MKDGAAPIVEPCFFVVTGGPGSGKTVLIEALAGWGLAHMPEAGRAIIRDQRAIGGPARPDADRAAFAEQMLAFELRSFREARALEGPVLFDRGLPDTVGYLRLCGLPVPDHALAAARLFRYAPTVFIAPPWPEIFRNDAERRQSMGEAERTFEAMVEAYGGFGYDLVPLPLASVEERVRFVADRISAALTA
ncbi:MULTISPECIES: AAA family ATPase [unclassified Aureimonas]|uniref:AAA family ATPase n=1 Tax=unclassified Aureimonas TaxID=2615206 RepID=UPI0007019814|nr:MULTISPECIES: AAA family ATPase [unclassified Aureimonas]KQT64427.1 ATPase [Aureimonas sp. Leaf427]KQT81747.1 ATPase [Aureimonas sp. Leaf460]